MKQAQNVSKIIRRADATGALVRRGSRLGAGTYRIHIGDVSNPPFDASSLFFKAQNPLHQQQTQHCVYYGCHALKLQYAQQQTQVLRRKQGYVGGSTKRKRKRGKCGHQSREHTADWLQCDGFKWL